MSDLVLDDNQIIVNDEVSLAADSPVSDGNIFKVDSDYRETPKDNFSRIFGAYKRQYAGVVKEYKSKQEYYSRSAKRKMKDENSRKRNAKRSRNSDLRGRRYF